MSKPKSKKLKTAVFSKHVIETPRHVNLSFELVTDDKNYTFHYFGKNIRENLSARELLDNLLIEISKNGLVELGLRNKSQLGGFEAIPLAQIKPCIYKKINLTPDTSLLVFRFSGYRMITYKPSDSGNDVLYILGYDFNYSAYDHGS